MGKTAHNMTTDSNYKIIRRTDKDSSTVEFEFNNGFWCSIFKPANDDEGGYEYQSDPDDEETYNEGGLWFEGKKVVDYDGAYDLPNCLRLALQELGYTTDELF